MKGREERSREKPRPSDKQTAVACSALLDVVFKMRADDTFSDCLGSYSALYNLFMHLQSSQTENLEALLLLLCPALTKIKTCVGPGSNPATDPQVRLTPRGCLFRGKSKGYNNVFGLLRPTLQHLLLGPPSLTSQLGSQKGRNAQLQDQKQAAAEQMTTKEALCRSKWSGWFAEFGCGSLRKQSCEPCKTNPFTCIITRYLLFTDLCMFCHQAGGWIPQGSCSAPP